MSTEFRRFFAGQALALLTLFLVLQLPARNDEQLLPITERQTAAENCR
jgi:hypothetical protein